MSYFSSRLSLFCLVCFFPPNFSLSSSSLPPSFYTRPPCSLSLSVLCYVVRDRGALCRVGKPRRPPRPPLHTPRRAGDAARVRPPRRPPLGAHERRERRVPLGFAGLVDPIARRHMREPDTRSQPSQARARGAQRGAAVRAAHVFMRTAARRGPREARRAASHRARAERQKRDERPGGPSDHVVGRPTR